MTETAAAAQGSGIDWFFDPISPFAYLGFHRLGELPAGTEIRFRPVLFAGLLAHWGQLGPAEIAPKRRHTGLAVMWRARQLGLTMTPPPRHPFNPLGLLRLCLATGPSRETVATIFDHVWGQGEDGEAPESLAGLAQRLGLSDWEARIAAPEIKAALRANTEAAIEAGVFGVPTAVFGGQLFWGEDMTDALCASLADPDLLASPALTAMAEIPAASTRHQSPAWTLHHVNLQATDVRASARFYTQILGMAEADWQFPPASEVGFLPADPDRLALFPAQTGARGANAGLHLIAPDPEFARKNGFDHNPSIGGHIAIQVPDLDAVMARLAAAGIPYSYAPTFAIPDMRHVYVYDPAMNLLELNEVRS
ncbi:MAG: DsbA family protein [Pseudomonadota bacterium]